MPSHRKFVPLLLAVLFCVATGFTSSPSWQCSIRSHSASTLSTRSPTTFRLKCLPSTSVEHLLSSDDATLAFWVFAFASSHIGMSATRSTIISLLGQVVSSSPFNLVGRDGWTLPEWWPADISGGSKLFPDADTAGRQIYRAVYSLISFATLGSAFAAYLHSSSAAGSAQAIGGTYHTRMTGDDASFLYNACLAAAALSFGASIASLFNASPLGLMPGFEAPGGSADAISGGTTTPGDIIGGIRRDDTLKFTARGLTRISRHPLILPVVPWGIATSYLAGNRLCDYILFGGLSLYAVAGCAAQDLRVIKEEGSVGTVFRPTDSAEEGQRLSQFFAQTSFVPFGAVLDGRQRIEDIMREVPWLGFIIGIPLGVLMEEKILQLLTEWSACSM